ncbi:MAG: amino acid-binding protein [Actinobacteria bacterium]|nr:amino acid-binding protein [Actinomycetota bacterium]
MSSFGITVVGHDRPGIVADVTGALGSLGGNIEDSSMTLLRGHFAWTLIVDADAAVGAVDEAVDPLRVARLQISVVELPAEAVEPDSPTHWLNVHGSDRSGIVSAITRELAAAGGNITDLSTRLVGSLYVVSADVTLPKTNDDRVLIRSLSAVAAELGVEVSLRPVDNDDVF